MSNRAISGDRRCPRSGYSLAELLLVLVLFATVLVAINAVLVSQRRFYTAHTRIIDTRDAVRTAAAVLSAELRELSPVGNDIYVATPDSVAFRAFRGFGVVCDTAEGRLRLWRVSGVFGDGARDSAVVFREHDFDSRSDDEWRAVRVAGKRTPDADRCLEGRAPELDLIVEGDLSGVTVGSPIRAFRSTVYRLYETPDGRWWLGQRQGGSLQPLAGPFAMPANGGLRLEYLDAGGAPVNDPTGIVQIRISVTGLSAGRIPLPDGVGFYADTLSTVVYLRNS